MDDLKPASRLTPMHGVEIWKNPKNKFTVVELHYTADPDKRSPDYKTGISSAMPRREFLREYELSWETWEGLPVYADFDSQIHTTKEVIEPHLGLPLLRGWDFGLTPSVIICQLQEDTLCAIKEFIGFNIGIIRFAEIVLPQCAQLFPLWPDKKRDWLDFIDPSGFSRKDTDERSCADILMDKGLNPMAGAIPFMRRKESVEHFLTRRTKNGPCFKVSQQGCPTLIRGFKGAYQYPEKMQNADAGDLRPLKNEVSHVHDALQMITSSFNRSTPSRIKAPIPPPKYSRDKYIREFYARK